MEKLYKKILILVVEDEKILINILEEKLMSEGFRVDKAFDGEQGLQIALKEHPDLILLDLLLPKVDGMSMLKKLRKDVWGSHAEVIILTNIKDTNKMVEGMSIDMDNVNNTYEYILKTDQSLDGLVSRIKERLKIK